MSLLTTFITLNILQPLLLTAGGATSHYASAFVAVSKPSHLRCNNFGNALNGGRKLKLPCDDFHGVHTNERHSFPSTALSSSPLDDFLGNIFGKDTKDGNEMKLIDEKSNNESSDEEMSLSSFQQELVKRQEETNTSTETSTLTNEDDEQEAEFGGYDLRDMMYYKYGECFDVEFQRVDVGVPSVYLNIMPFRLGGRTFRHETEHDYLCHLQAVVEILIKYNQLDYVLVQLTETKKKPRAGTSPLIAVPLRLDLTPEQVDKILG